MSPPNRISDHLGTPVRPMTRNVWFWLVLALKLAASATLGSHWLRDLFIPFVSWFVAHPTSNPWDHFLVTGPTDAFPYSVAMLAALAAPQAIASMVAPGLAAHEWARMLLIRLPMLTADLGIFWILLQWFETHRGRVLWLYWCSPILFFISYVHGQIDAIPTALLMLSLFLLFRNSVLRAGLALGLGIAAKMHLLIAVPFLLIYLWNTRVGRARVTALGWFLCGGFIAGGLPNVVLVGDPGYRAMVLGTPEAGRLFELALPITATLKIYLAPVALVVIMARSAATHWSNRDVLCAFLALAFGVLLLFVPPMPGWYYWSIPLVTYFFVQHSEVSPAPLVLLNVFHVVYYVFFWNVRTEQLPGVERALAESVLLGQSRLESIAFTALQGSLALVMYWVYRLGIESNAALRSRVPVLVGIAGDSGAGKHTLAALLRDVLTSGAVQTNGDDYHRWPRGHEAWDALTALSPRANRMALAAEHEETLKRGQPIRKQLYDHATGAFTDSVIVTPRRFVLLVGLHSFALRRMRSQLDLRIYVDTEESLRHAWKIARDQAERGYEREKVLEQIRGREADAVHYVRQQRSFADWVIRYEGRPEAFTARHLLWNDVPLDDLMEALAALPGVKVTSRLEADLERQSVEVSGSISGDVVSRLANQLFADTLEQLDRSAIVWRPDHNGITQLLFLAILNDLPVDA
jgi:uridine kinase